MSSLNSAGAVITEVCSACDVWHSCPCSKTCSSSVLRAVCDKSTPACRKKITQAEKVSKVGSQASHSTKGHRNSLCNLSRECPSSQGRNAGGAQGPDCNTLREHKSTPQEQGSCCLNTEDSAGAEHIMHHKETIAKGTAHSDGRDSQSCLGMKTPAKAGPTGGKRQRAASEAHVVTDNRGELRLAVTQQGKRART